MRPEMGMPRQCIFMGMLMIFALTSFGQYNVRMIPGMTHYMGDLAPYESIFSYSKGHVAAGVAYTLKVNEIISYYSKFTRGKISGDDANSADQWRRRRNLSFESNLYEIGAGFEVSLITLVKGFDKFGIDVYLLGGVNLFHFNPRTFYMGEWHDLQPLGTEGQGAPGIYKTPYKLWQFSFPFGFGASFKLSDIYSMGLEFAPRATLTDYLDDVSQVYLDRTLQLPLQGELTTALANRIEEGMDIDPGEIITTTGSDPYAGTQRGDSIDRDWYIFSSFSFAMELGSGASKFLKKQKKRMLK